MATDHSPPKTIPIVIGAVLAVGVLVGLKPIFDTYYLEMFEAEAYRKVGSVQPTELLALRAAEAKGFATAQVPLDKAMDTVAHNRMVGSIAPQQSTDTASLVGWAGLPTTGLGSLPPLPPVPSASAVADGGAAPATTAGAAPSASGSAAPPSIAPSSSAAHPAIVPTVPSAAHSSSSSPAPSAPPAPHP